jgi:hypothetical protein
MSDTFLPPIESPQGLIMKLYYFTRRQFGKVLTPLKVHSARLPPTFGLFYSKVSKLDQKLTLSPEMVLLIRHQVALINICLFCIDIARSFTIKASMNQAKFDALDQYLAASSKASFFSTTIRDEGPNVGEAGATVLLFDEDQFNRRK